MNIRTSTAEDEKAVKALWAYCFEKESDPWFRWYFEREYRKEEVLVGEEKGKIACNLHRRPYTLSVRGKKVKTDYIVGVATHPAARGRGYAKELLRRSFREAVKEKKGVVILMPSSADYYYPKGFSFYVHQWKRKTSPIQLAKLGEKTEAAGLLGGTEKWTVLNDIYMKYVSERNGYTLRDEESWKKHMEAQFCDGGFIAVAEDEKGPAGYIFYHIEDRKMTVSEMAFTSEKGRKGLYAYMAGHEGSLDECEWYEPLDDKHFMFWNDGAEHEYIKNSTFPFMMGRITDPVLAFEGLCCETESDDSFSFRLTDPFLPENSGIYTVTVKKGQLHIEKEDTARAERNKQKLDVTVGAGTLNQLFFGALSVGESEKLGGLKWQGEKEKNEKEEIIHRLLPPMKNWINEWY